jgi:sugar lactone lactonase YvrE
MQSVPTGMAIAPDNNIYIAEYTGLPFPPRGADIYRWDGTTLSTVASNFTNLIDLAFDSNGNLYALEYASNVLQGNFTGNLWQIDTNGTRRRINVQGLQFPTSLAITEDDTIYIANNGFARGVGEVIELQPSNIVPEPNLLFSSVILNLGFLGYLIKFKR